MRKRVTHLPAPIAGAFARQRRDERGQTMAEYGVVLAVIALAVVGGLTMLSGSLSSAFSAVASIFP
jgi:pilus assembly protein Flp/PilA